jgi:hypothetical protein
MAVAALKQAPAPALKMLFHATVLVTRAEEWCVEAETAEARQLLVQGGGHRCHLGDCLHAEVQQLEE